MLLNKIRFTFLLGIFFLSVFAADAGVKKIGVLYNPKVKTYSKIIAGFKDQFAGNNEVEVLDIPCENNEKLIQKNISEKNPDYLFSLGWAVTKVAADSKIPGVFTMVQNPKGSGFIKSNNFPAGFMAGISWNVSFKQKLEILIKMIPLKNVIGVIYSDLSKDSVAELKKTAKLFNYKVVAHKIKDGTKINKALKKLKSKDVELILALPDRFVINRENLGELYKFSSENKIPIIGYSNGMTHKGALISFFLDYPGLGVQSAKVMQDLVSGQKPYLLEYMEAESVRYSINKQTAKACSIDLNKSLTDQAYDVVN